MWLTVIHTEREENMTERSIAFGMRATVRIEIVCRSYQQHAAWLGLASVRSG